jgi:predicted ATP-binding protein involved in virulence
MASKRAQDQEQIRHQIIALTASLVDSEPWVMTADAFELRRLVQQHFLGRISSEMFDPGYRNHLALIADGYDVSVFLDDKLQDGCITADPDEGFVQRRGSLRSLVTTDMCRGSVSIRISKKKRVIRCW